MSGGADDRTIQTLILRGIDPPYLIVRVVPSLFHVTVLPAHLSDQDLMALARAQVRANGFDACLVLAARHGPALPGDGAKHPVADVPFARFDHWSSAPVIGRLQTPSPLPTTDESLRRQARLEAAVPCHGKVLRVHCRRENQNRCARCGEPFDRFRLNANHYDARLDVIVHVPGFYALTHECAAPDGPLPPHRDDRPRRLEPEERRVALVGQLAPRRSKSHVNITEADEPHRALVAAGRYRCNDGLRGLLLPGRSWMRSGGVEALLRR